MSDKEIGTTENIKIIRFNAAVLLRECGLGSNLIETLTEVGASIGIRVSDSSSDAIHTNFRITILKDDLAKLPFDAIDQFKSHEDYDSYRGNHMSLKLSNISSEVCKELYGKIKKILSESASGIYSQIPHATKNRLRDFISKNLDCKDVRWKEDELCVRINDRETLTIRINEDNSINMNLLLKREVIAKKVSYSSNVQPSLINISTDGKRIRINDPEDSNSMRNTREIEESHKREREEYSCTEWQIEQRRRQNRSFDTHQENYRKDTMPLFKFKY